MFARTLLLACAAATFATLAAPSLADTSQSPRCDEMSFRVYFDHGSAALSPLARQTIALAERDVADCPYAELHARLDPSEPMARARGEAILQAASALHWNVARIEARMQRAALSNGPEFAEVVMTPNVLPQAPELTNRSFGV